MQARLITLLRIALFWAIACTVIALIIALTVFTLDQLSSAATAGLADRLYVLRIITTTVFAAAVPGLIAALVAGSFGLQRWTTYTVIGALSAVPAALVVAYFVTAPIEGRHYREDPTVVERFSLVVPALMLAVPCGALAGGLTGWLAFWRRDQS